MGQSQSRSDVFINSPSTSCSGLTDKEVVFYTKQYFTINKIMDILIDVENGVLKTFEPVLKYLLDLHQIIPDIMNSEPSEITKDIYKIRVETVGISNNAPMEAYYTVLHDYNDFVLKGSKIMGTEKAQSKAKEIREEFSIISEKLLSYIAKYCSEIGIIEKTTE